MGRALLSLILLAACEIQPAPKKQAEPPQQPPAAQPQPAPVAPPPVVAVTDAGGVPGYAATKVEITPACLEVAAKVAQVFIDAQTEPAQRSILEQERANMTRKVGEACTTQGWSEDARKCYLATKTPAEVKACELKYPGRPERREQPVGIPPPNP